MTDLSGRVLALETAYNSLAQQLLQKIDLVAASTQSVEYNTQLDGLYDDRDNLDGRTATLESKTINQSIEIAALKARMGSGQVSGLYVDDVLLKNILYLSGRNNFDIDASGQVIYFDPGFSPRSFSITDPQVDDSFTILHNNGAGLNIDSIYSITKVAGSASVNWNLYIDSNRANTGTAVSINGFLSESTNTGVQHTFDNYSIPSGYFLWVTVTGVQGTINELFSRITFSN